MRRLTRLPALIQAAITPRNACVATILSAALACVVLGHQKFFATRPTILLNGTFAHAAVDDEQFIIANRVVGPIVWRLAGRSHRLELVARGTWSPAELPMTKVGLSDADEEVSSALLTDMGSGPGSRAAIGLNHYKQFVRSNGTTTGSIAACACGNEIIRGVVLPIVIEMVRHNRVCVQGAHPSDGLVAPVALVRASADLVVEYDAVQRNVICADERCQGMVRTVHVASRTTFVIRLERAAPVESRTLDRAESTDSGLGRRSPDLRPALFAYDFDCHEQSMPTSGPAVNTNMAAA